MNKSKLEAWVEKQPDSQAIKVIRELIRGLEFYGDPKKYWMKEVTTNLQETTAVFKVDDPSKLPTDFKSRSYQVTARLKVDQGKTAREALDLDPERL